MKHLFAAVALVLVAGLARADGVPLFTPAAHNTALAQKYQKTTEWAGSMTTVKVNPYAIDSNVITATVGGKAYRFVGAKVSSPLTLTENDKPVTYANAATWTGKAGDNQVLLLSRVGPSITAEFSLNGERFTLMHDGMLIKVRDTSVPMNAKVRK